MSAEPHSGWLKHVFKKHDRPHLGPISQAERARRRKQYERETEGYAFEHDWFSGNLRRFEYFLSPLKGSDCRLLEIGTDEGRAAVWLMNNVATAEGSRLTCVDIREHENWRWNIEATRASHRVDFREGRSADMLLTLPRSHFDFIYVDGYHGQVEVLEDAVLSFRLAKVGSIIAFDDYTWESEAHDLDGTPKPAVDAFCSIYRNKIDLLTKGRQVWVRKTSD
jgi:hypothetical protein